ncbi:MAG: flagellum-specific ATP synthase FliI [Pseudomonadota bacterium]
MTRPLTQRLTDDVSRLKTRSVWGRVAAIDQGVLKIHGLNAVARTGEGVVVDCHGAAGGQVMGEIVALTASEAIVYAFDRVDGVRISDRASLTDVNSIAPCDGWLGRMVDPLGQAASGSPLPLADEPRRLSAGAPPAALRRGFGSRIACGLNAFDTFLPICRGQRIGLFAAPGVGKSSLVADLATRADADVVVVALIGERGREVRAFYDHALNDDVRPRTVIVAASSDQTAPLKKRAALTAMATAERFRDEGKHVLLLFDSLTRFADAHREMALAAGETPSLRAYPPSTFQALSSLVERAGAGVDDPDNPNARSGDITAVFTILAAAGDMDEPVPDAVRGFLDGHVILDRAIAERGRFPAIDVLRSASRSLPDAATAWENDVLIRARQLLGAYRDGEIMVKAGLYEQGADPLLDQAVAVFPSLDAFLAGREGDPETAFGALADIVGVADESNAVAAAGETSDS